MQINGSNLNSLAALTQSRQAQAASGDAAPASRSLFWTPGGESGATGAAHSSVFPGPAAFFEQVGKGVTARQWYSWQKGDQVGFSRIGGRKFRRSFNRPVDLKGDKVLYQGRIYSDRAALAKDLKDGRVDGLAADPFDYWKILQDEQKEKIQELLAKAKAGNINMEDFLMQLIMHISSILDRTIQTKSQNLQDKAESIDKIEAQKQQDAQNGTEPPKEGYGENAANTNMQLEMMGLQRLFSMRQQMFQAITNMQKNLHDTSMAVVNNTRP